MVTLITKEELEALTTHSQPLSVSILMSTHRYGVEKTREDPLRLKNLVREAERLLIEAGLRAPDARKRLEPLEGLVEDAMFWQRQSDGLAAFMDGGKPRVHRVPLQLQQTVVVSEYFHVKPLLPLLYTSKHFYVLALSKNLVGLFQATPHGIHQVPLKNVPANFDEAMKYYEFEKHAESHTGAVSHGKGGGQSPVFHGTTTDETYGPERMIEYCRLINRGVREVLKNEKVPLILAATDPTASVYREVNTYPHLLDQSVRGNPDRVDPEVLHKEGLAIAEPIFREDECAAMGRYRQSADTNLASDNLEKILLAARNKQVDTLFVAIDEPKWGRYYAETGKTVVHETQEAGDSDLLNLAAIWAFNGGGKVYAIDKRQMPGGNRVAVALLRYPAS